MWMNVKKIIVMGLPFSKLWAGEMGRKDTRIHTMFTFGVLADIFKALYEKQNQEKNEFL